MFFSHPPFLSCNCRLLEFSLCIDDPCFRLQVVAALGANIQVNRIGNKNLYKYKYNKESMLHNSPNDNNIPSSFFFSCTSTFLCESLPFCAICSRPTNDLHVAVQRCLMTRPPIPGAVSFTQPLEKIKLTASCGKFAQEGTLQRHIELNVKPFQHLGVSSAGCMTSCCSDVISFDLFDDR